MDWQPLQILLKAPKKKYIKKLIEYAALLTHCKAAIPHQTATPIAQQFPADLELTSEEAHQLITALIALLTYSQTVDYDAAVLREHLNKHIDETLVQPIVQIISKMSQDLKTHANTMVGQTSRLVNFDWQLDMEVATEKGKCSVPVVDLELSLAKESQIENSRIEMSAAEFTVFFKNLNKIKEQLAELVSEKQSA